MIKQHGNRLFGSLERSRLIGGRTARIMSLKRTNTTDRDISPPPPKRKTTTTSNAVANFFKPASQKEPDKITFDTLHGSLLRARYHNAHTVAAPRPAKVAAFDFDDTLIKTKSGNVFARGSDDWKWWHSSVPSKLRQLAAEGYVVVVVSNQSGVKLKAQGAGDMKSLSNFKAKITAVLNALDLPITVYAAAEKDLFRKPRTGMWEQMIKDYEIDELDHSSCVFVGDAAGREADKAAKARKDHSCSDRDFAANVGISFQTPEEYFLGEVAKPFTRAFDPAPYLASKLDSAEDSTTSHHFVKNSDVVELVLFCGSPGAGKSTFYWDHMKPLGYERVNQDTLKTRDNCIKVATQTIKDNKSVVVDNTNADVEVRAVWIALAKKLGVPIRLIHFTAPAKLSEHNDTVRALSADGLVCQIPF